jgi:hypothetical protein
MTRRVRRHRAVGRLDVNTPTVHRRATIRTYETGGWLRVARVCARVIATTVIPHKAYADRSRSLKPPRPGWGEASARSPSRRVKLVGEMPTWSSRPFRFLPERWEGRHSHFVPTQDVARTILADHRGDHL